MYDYIAYKDGSLGTIWGPCSGDGSKNPCECKQCRHANQLDEEGKDFNLEYENARARNFDRKDR